MGTHYVSFKVEDFTSTQQVGSQYDSGFYPSITIHASRIGEDVVGGKSNFGHVFLSVNTGFYQGTIGFSSGVSNDTAMDNLSFNDHQIYVNASTHTITSMNYQFYNMTNQLAQIFQNFESGARSPTDYFLIGANCIEFVEDILAEVGINLNLSWTPDGVANNIANIGQNFYTPLVIDLLGNGIETLSIEEGVVFNYDGDSTAEQTGWIGQNSGLLVVDVNRDGIINDASEFFGDRTVLADGTIAQDGVQALSAFDSNTDGVINQDDAIWKDLLVWVDNGDGQSSANELIDLTALGIESISLNFVKTNEYDQNGNFHGDSSTVQWNNGTQTDITDVYFKVNSSSIPPNTINDYFNDLIVESGSMI